MDTLDRFENFWIGLEARIMLEKPPLDRELAAFLSVHHAVIQTIVAIQHDGTISDPADRARATLATALINGYLDTLSGIELEEAAADVATTIRRIAAATGHLFYYPDDQIAAATGHLFDHPDDQPDAQPTDAPADPIEPTGP